MGNGILIMEGDGMIGDSRMPAHLNRSTCAPGLSPSCSITVPSLMPLSYLENGLVAFSDWAPEEIGRTFFSLDELARQVRARIIVKRLRIGV